MAVRPTWEFTLFGGGPRTYLGLWLVYTESAYVTVMLLHEFAKLENRDTEARWMEEMRMTAWSKNGAKMALILDVEMT